MAYENIHFEKREAALLQLRAEQAAEKREADAAKAAEALAIASVILTTESVPNMKITRRIGLVTASGNSGLLSLKNGKDALREAKDSVLLDLKEEAHRLGASAVVGVTIQYLAVSATQIAALGVNATVLIAAGTAVEIEGKIN